MPVCPSPAINVTADQALAAWVPTVEPQHGGGDCRLVDKYEVGLIKKALLPNPASARAGHVGALPLFQDGSFAVNDPISRPGVIPGTVGLG